MRFQYIGVKQDGERAFERETGIVWMPGDERDVTDLYAASEMVKHPTVWQALEPLPPEALALPERPRSAAFGYIDDEVMFDELEEVEARRKAAAAQPTPAPTAAPKADDPLVGMDDAAVRAFAKERGLKIQGIALTKGDNLRAKVRAAMEA